jgi:hypothetical protein
MGLGPSFPPAELATRDSALFVEMKRLFSIAPKDEKEAKSQKCFSLRNRRRMRGSEVLDAATASVA